MSSGLSHRRAIIVGAGHAGLAVAAALMAEGLRPQQDFVVMDAAPPGQRSWSLRWHSMKLLSDARHSALPGYPHAGDQRRAVRTDEMADYLTHLENTLGIETRWNIEARKVEHLGSGPTLLLSTSNGSVQTRNVVCATGAAGRPRVPEWAQRLSVPGVALHSSAYQYPRQVPDGSVLVVGGGNSGVQLARELSASHSVALAVRNPRLRRPASRYGAYAGRRWGRSGAEPVFDDSPAQLRRAGVELMPTVVGAHDTHVSFQDGSREAPDSIIFATGFTPADQWIPAPRAGDRRRRTLTDLPGLFVAGIPSYSDRAAATIAGVWRDATTIARHIINRP